MNAEETREVIEERENRNRQTTNDQAQGTRPYQPYRHVSDGSHTLVHNPDGTAEPYIPAGWENPLSESTFDRGKK